MTRMEELAAEEAAREAAAYQASLVELAQAETGYVQHALTVLSDSASPTESEYTYEETKHEQTSNPYVFNPVITGVLINADGKAYCNLTNTESGMCLGVHEDDIGWIRGVRRWLDDGTVRTLDNTFPDGYDVDVQMEITAK